MPTMYTEGSHSVICYDAKIYPNTSIYKKLYPHALEEDGKLIVYKVRYMFENYQDHANLNNLFKEAYGGMVESIASNLVKLGNIK